MRNLFFSYQTLSWHENYLQDLKMKKFTFHEVSRNESELLDLPMVSVLYKSDCGLRFCEILCNDSVFKNYYPDFPK